MYNTYVGSTLSLRCKGSFSFSLNDYSYLLNDRFDENPKPFSSQSSCACCSNSMHREPIVNPNFLYGLRKSDLIQCSASRKLILGGGDLYYRRFPAYDVCQTCCEFVKERSVSGSRRLGEGRFWPKVALGKSERHREHDIDVEVVLSLLTEKVSEECFGVKERNVRSLRRKEEKKRGSGTAYRSKKENDTYGFLKGNLKREFGSVTKESREVDYRRKEDKESHLSGETQWIRKNGSSCSSYYSCGSLGEFESDDDVQVRQEGYRGESSSEFKRSSKESGELTCDGETVEEVKSRGGVIKERGVVIQQGKIAPWSYKTSSGVECDWRKKSEKKLAEELTGQTESLNKSLNMHTEQKFVGREETPALDVTFGGETRKQYSKRDEQINGQFGSSTKYKHFTRNQEIHDSKQNLAAESLVLDKRNKQTKTASRVRHSQKLDKVSKIQDMNDRVTSISQVQSEAIVKRREDKSSEILSSVNDTEGNYHIIGQRDSRHMDSRRKFQEVTEISDTDGIHIDNRSASLRQSDTRMENQHFATSQQAFRKTDLRKGSQDTSNISVVHSTDASQRDSKKRISSQETYSASVVQSTEETIERQNLIENKVFQIGSRTETQRPTKALSFSEGTTMEASASQSDLVLKTQPIEQHIGMDVGVEISSELVTPLPSQLVERGPMRVEPTSHFQIQEVPSDSLGSGSVGRASRDETHEDPLNFIYQEDALGSADRLQKSSMQFVGEFVEKVTHEVSTFKIQTELINKSHKRQNKSSSQYGSGDFKPKEHESRCSSRSSGVKGPSDEIWDVTGPPIQESSLTEAPESTNPTTNSITKRNGRSLWHIISDIVRLRWASGSHNSPQKSIGRSSPNQSVNSEAWFSGLELDEKGNENVKGGKESMSQGSTSSKQHNLVTIPMGNQGEGSTSACSRDKKGSSIASKEICLGSTEVNVGRSGTEVVESSVSMPSLQLSRLPHIDRISEAGKIDVSASGSLVQEQASDTGLIGKSGTEGRDGELKRRKLQRNSQLPKDRFDEWEEAYKIEREQRRMDEVFMREALLEAKKGADIWEVPVGAVLVQHGKIIARGYNVVEELRDCTAHAEMICIREASNLLHTWRLSETTLYITLEPCPMCAGAILQARIDSVVWGAPNKLLGADGSWISLFPIGTEGGNISESADKPPAPIHPFHPKIVVRREVLATECADAMQQFSQRRRKKEKKAGSPSSCLPVSNHPSKLLTMMHDAFHFMFCL